MKAFFVVLVAFLFVTTSLSFGQIQKEAVNGWHIVDTLNVWEASSRIHTSGGILFEGGDNYQIFRLKTYDSGKPSYVEFEKKIKKIKTPIGFTWYGGILSAFPNRNTMVSYRFSIRDGNSFYSVPDGGYLGSDSFMLMETQGYFHTTLPDSVEYIRLRIYPGPLGDAVRLMELGFDIFRGIKENGDYFLIDPFEDTTVVGVEDEPGLPKSFTISQNYPNPFNPITSIKYSVESIQYIQIAVYNILGQEVQKLVDEEKFPGEYTISFDGSNLPSGIYFYRLTAGQYTETKKMILQK